MWININLMSDRNHCRRNACTHGFATRARRRSAGSDRCANVLPFRFYFFSLFFFIIFLSTNDDSTSKMARQKIKYTKNK